MSKTIDLKQKKAALEAILFLSGEPQSVKNLAKILGLKAGQVKELFLELWEDYKKRNSGLSFIEMNGKIQMTTSAFVSEEVKKFLSKDFTQDLSPVLLETLAIIAYKGPLSRSQIEEIRGVNSTYPLRMLSLRGLIEKEPHPTIPNAYIYKVSFDFLRHLGLDSIKELPDYERLSKEF